MRMDNSRLSRRIRLFAAAALSPILSGCLTTGSAYDPWFSSPRYTPTEEPQVVRAEPAPAPPPAQLMLESDPQRQPTVVNIRATGRRTPDPEQDLQVRAMERRPESRQTALVMPPEGEEPEVAPDPLPSYEPPPRDFSAYTEPPPRYEPASVEPASPYAPPPAESTGDELGLPPDARPGECYAKVYIPPVYEMREEKVLLQEESQRVEIVPAEYEWVEEKVVIREAAEDIEIIPAEFQLVDEKVMISPASTRIEEIPAEYEWIQENVMIKPAEYAWKKGRGPIEELDNATGEILCLVEIPAEYETVQKKILKKPAATRTLDIPPEYRSIQKEVMVKPPQVRRIPVPPEYTTILVKKMIQPERQVVVPVPPQYGTIRKEVMVSEGRMVWQRVLCETNLSPDVIRRIQEALSQRGYDVGAPNGELNQETVSAVKSYQRVNGLAVGGLTYETLESLGISVNI